MATNATIDLAVAGMTCGSCVRHVTGALQGVEGVAEARVSLASGRATVSYDPEVATEAGMIAAVGEAGYRAAVAPDERPRGLPVRSGCGSACCA